MDKLTKIVATIGPSCDSPELIEKLILAGVNIFRFNFKHNILEWHSDRIQRVNRISEKLGLPVGTLIDLQGPEIRINMSVDQLTVKENDFLSFGEGQDVSISHPQIIRHLSVGQKFWPIADHFLLRLKKKREKYIYDLTHQAS